MMKVYSILCGLFRNLFMASKLMATQLGVAGYINGARVHRRVPEHAEVEYTMRTYQSASKALKVGDRWQGITVISPSTCMYDEAPMADQSRNYRRLGYAFCNCLHTVVCSYQLLSADGL